MTQSYFQSIAPIKFEGPETENPLAYRYYDTKRLVLGKSMAEHLRPARLLLAHLRLGRQ